MLHEAKPRTANKLAAELGVSLRTFDRTLALVEEFGYTVWFDHSRWGYRIHSKDQLLPSALNVPEAKEFMTVASMFNGGPEIPLLLGVGNAMVKVEKSLPLDVQTQAWAASQHTQMRLGPMSRIRLPQEAVDRIDLAIQHHERLRCRYNALEEGRQFVFDLDPYWRLLRTHGWYLIGFSHEHGKMKTFKLCRFEAAERTGLKFARREGYELEDYLGNAWEIDPGEGSYNVRLRFDPLSAPYIAEEDWHKTQRLKWRKDGSLLAEFTVDGLDEIACWVFCRGAHVKVLEPDALRERVAELSSPALGRPYLGVLDM